MSPALFEDCGHCGGGDQDQVGLLSVHVQPDVQQRGPGEEDLSGQVQLHGLSQLLRLEPGTVAWTGTVSDSGVHGRDTSGQTVLEKYYFFLCLQIDNNWNSIK